MTDSLTSRGGNVEKRIESLQERVAKLEIGSTAGGGEGPKIKDDKNHPHLKALKPEASGLELERIKAERDKAFVEIEELKKIILKQEYRILHLVRALEEEEEKNKKR